MQGRSFADTKGPSVTPLTGLHSEFPGRIDIYALQPMWLLSQWKCREPGRTERGRMGPGPEVSAAPERMTSRL